MGSAGTEGSSNAGANAATASSAMRAEEPVRANVIAARRLALIVAALSAIGPFATDTYLPAFRDIARDLNATPVQLQQTLSLYMLFLGLMNLWHGPISDALGRRRVLFVGMLLFAFASLGASLSTSIEQLWFWRSLQGAAGGVGMAVGRAVVRDSVAGYTAQRILAQVMMVFSIAPAIAPIIGGYLTVWSGWRGVFAFLTAFGIALAAIVWFLLPETLPESRRQSLHPQAMLQGWISVLRRPKFWRLSLALAFNFLGFFVFVLSAPEFMREVLGRDETGFAWLFIPAMIGMVMGGYLASRLAGRRSLAASIRLGYWIMALAVALNIAFATMLPGQLPWATLPLLVYTMGMGVTMSALQVLLLEVDTTRTGMVSSAQAFSQSLVNSAVAAAFAPLVWHSALSMAVAMLLFCAAGLSVCVLDIREAISETTHTSPT